MEILRIKFFHAYHQERCKISMVVLKVCFRGMLKFFLYTSYFDLNITRKRKKTLKARPNIITLRGNQTNDQCPANDSRQIILQHIK